MIGIDEHMKDHLCRIRGLREPSNIKPHFGQEKVPVTSRKCSTCKNLVLVGMREKHCEVLGFIGVVV